MDEKGRWQRMSAVLNQWFYHTSICGISQARDSRAPWELTLWLVVSLAATVFTGRQVVHVFNTYYKYEVDSKVEVLHRNLVRKSAVASIETYYSTVL